LIDGALGVEPPITDKTCFKVHRLLTSQQRFTMTDLF
jgi:hypothetical protein